MIAVLCSGLFSSVDAHAQEQNGLPQSFLDKMDRFLKPSVKNPSIELIKSSLIGRRLTEQPDGYHFDGWYWEIADGEIKSMELTGENRYKDAYVCNVNMILQAEGSAHEAYVKLTWSLDDKKIWVLDLVECIRINIVTTGRYDDCVIVERKGWSGEYYLEIRNRCDIPLVVGGRVLLEYGNGWKKFSIVVDGCSTEKVGGLFVGSVKDWTVDFVEKP